MLNKNYKVLIGAQYAEPTHSLHNILVELLQLYHNKLVVGHITHGLFVVNGAIAVGEALK